MPTVTRLFLISCAGNCEQNLQAPRGWFHLGYPAPHILFWLWSLVRGETAFHFSCFLSDMIWERVGLPLCLPLKKQKQKQNK